MDSLLRSRASGERKSRFRPQVERLEERTLLATLTVTSLADSGAGTLRNAIVQANADPSPDTIVFAPALTSDGPATVALSALGDATAGKSALLVTSPITIAGPLANYGITLSMDSDGPRLSSIDVFATPPNGGVFVGG